MDEKLSNGWTTVHEWSPDLTSGELAQVWVDRRNSGDGGGVVVFFQAEDGIRDAQESRGLGDVYKRQDYRGI